MRAPRGLDASGRGAWREACRTLAALGEDPRLSIGALERYAQAVSAAAVLRREWETLGSPVVVTGARGGARTHPLVGAMERQDRHAADLGERLGLSPAARRKLGRQVQGGRPPGAASAADRRQNVVAMAPPRRSRRSEPSRPA